MNKDQLIDRLNWFYSLELNQVDLYTSQSASFKDYYTGLVFERISHIEQQHVRNLAALIKELGGIPSPIGDVVSPILGNIAGKLISLTGLDDTLKMNIIIEQKAMKDYKEMIHALKQDRAHSPELLQRLEYNFIDESLHTEWFKSKLYQIQHVEYALEV